MTLLKFLFSSKVNNSFDDMNVRGLLFWFEYPMELQRVEIKVSFEMQCLESSNIKLKGDIESKVT